MSVASSNKHISVVFLGSGPVAEKSLRHINQVFSIEAVITKPRASGYRGPVPVLETAKELSLDTHQVASRPELDALMSHTKFRSQLAIVVDFGIIVSKNTIQSFPLGIINSHFSLLPKLRGADPITFAILEGLEKTGVSLMLIEPELDTGKLIGQKSLPITANQTTSGLTEALITLSNSMLDEYLPPYVAGTVKPRNQPHPDRATYTRKLTKADGHIDWNKSAVQIEREIRAYQEWPKSYTTLGGVDITIVAGKPTKEKNSPGQLVLGSHNTIKVGCGEGTLEIMQLRPSGKKTMSVSAFLAGYRDRLAV